MTTLRTTLGRGTAAQSQTVSVSGTSGTVKNAKNVMTHVPPRHAGDARRVSSRHSRSCSARSASLSNSVTSPLPLPGPHRRRPLLRRCRLRHAVIARLAAASKVPRASSSVAFGCSTEAQARPVAAPRRKNGGPPSLNASVEAALAAGGLAIGGRRCQGQLQTGQRGEREWNSRFARRLRRKGSQMSVYHVHA